jgi:hypothetical protein
LGRYGNPGHACRSNGVVNNGVLVWTRRRFIKDPNTGKRVPWPNPEAKWIRTEVSELRIVDEELWQQVKLRLRSSLRPRPRASEPPARNGLCRSAFLQSAGAQSALASFFFLATSG